MTLALRDALDRTLLLSRDEIDHCATDADLLSALTDTTVVLVADRANLASHSAQSAFITAALLAARSGHQVHVIAPDLALVGQQPPLKAGGIVSGLLEVGGDLLPDREIHHGLPRQVADVEILFGDTRTVGAGRSVIAVNAGPWSAELGIGRLAGWKNESWPFGGMAVATLVAAEVFKLALLKLKHALKNADLFSAVFDPVKYARFDLAPKKVETARNLGDFDFISAGAIANACMFALARIPGVTGNARVIDDDANHLSNLNRNALLRRSALNIRKVESLAAIQFGALRVNGVCARYDSTTTSKLGQLAPAVLTGVDHIPTRWLIQSAKPTWFGIGATTHWSAMASFHVAGAGCAGCLHPVDDPSTDPIPTVAFVSFWAGLLLATYFVRMVSRHPAHLAQQQIYMTPLRPEAPFWGPVGQNAKCPVLN